MTTNFISKNIPPINELKELFISGEPYPHVVIDNFLEQQIFDRLLVDFQSFYKSNEKEGKLYKTDIEKNKWSSQGLTLSPFLKEVGDFLSSDEILHFLHNVTGFEKLSSIKGYNSDSLGFFSLMKKGSYLGPHIDHMYDMTGNSGYHVVNIILYISKDWNPNWGGNTFLRNRRTNKYSSVEFKPNRALIFLHSPLSEHGTTKLSSYSNEDRIAIYFDYYSKEQSPYKHLGLKFNMAKSPHLFFLPNKIEYLKLKNKKYLFFHISHRLEQLKTFFKIK
jgi:Rps23 Pro-64 3,4-dihydroxylase Tpa1-like proline 4-hydroxylase